MQFGVLGPLRVLDAAGAEVPIRSVKQRLLLVMLLCHAPRSVSAGQLIDTLWSGRPPAAAHANLQVYVHRLRRAIGEDRISYDPGGYAFVAAGDEVDIDRFERAIEQARLASDAGDHDAAATGFAAALELWRGPAFQGIEEPPAVRAETARLEELRLTCLEDRIDADLALGRHAALIAELATAAGRHPLRERLRGQLMLALYRTGRAAEALEVYREGRRTLIEELGIEPGPELRRLEQAILSDDPDLAAGASLSPAPTATAPAPTAPAPAELPPANRTFRGRQQELARLAEALAGSSPIVAVSGPGGVGKSALIIAAAGQAVDDFRDGQLYVNLHGASPGMQPLGTYEVLGRFLRALGLEDRQIPVGIEEAAARFRTLTAGRRLLVVLDDASNAEQVRPLLPAPGSAVLITSRPVLATLDGATHLQLGALPADAAMDLLAGLAGAERISSDSVAAERIVRMCDHLPLAIRISGARLAARPDWTVRGFADRIENAHARLDELQHADLAIRSSFAVSYQALPEGIARTFQLLGLMDLPDIGAAAAAALIDEPITSVQRSLDHLVDAQLLRAESDRYSLHDLLRLFAREQSAADLSDIERDDAERRLLHHYLATSRNALQVIHPLSKERLTIGVPESTLAAQGEKFPDVDAVTSWIRAESDNIVACARHTATRPEDGAAILAALAAAIHLPFKHQGYATHLITINKLTLRAAEEIDDRDKAARANHDLGQAYDRADRHDEATHHLESALAAWREAGDRDLEALALDSLAENRLHQNRIDEAIEYCHQTLELCRETGYDRGAIIVLNNLASIYLHSSRFREAITALHECLEGWPDGVDSDRGVAMFNLGEAYLAVGQAGRAIDYYERAIVESRAGGDSFTEAHLLWRSGTALHALGHLDTARRQWRNSLDMLCTMDVITADEATETLAAPVPVQPEILREL